MSVKIIRDGDFFYCKCDVREILEMLEPGDKLEVEPESLELRIMQAIEKQAPDVAKVLKTKAKRLEIAKRYRVKKQYCINAKKREKVVCSACGEHITRGSFYNHRNHKHPGKSAEPKRLDD